jgi:MYXO-CTERM domain-containing protein
MGGLVRIGTLVGALIAGLCFTACGWAATDSINISFDASGDITVTRYIAPGGTLPSGTITVGPVTENPSGGFDHMGSTLTYSLPNYGYIFQTADSTERSAWILTEPGNSNLVAGAVLFVGSNIVVYNRLTDSNPLDLAQAYGTPIVYQTGLPTTQDPSTPTGLDEDLQQQNTASDLVGAFTEYTVTPEVAGTNSYTIDPDFGQAGMVQYDNIDFATTITYTMDNVIPASTSIPEPGAWSAAAVGAALLLRRRRVIRPAVCISGRTF